MTTTQTTEASKNEWRVTRCDNNELLGTFDNVWDARKLAVRMDRRGIATNVSR